MTEKRFINDVSEILDTWFGYMGEEEPSEREIKEKDYLVIGVARSQRDAESICEKLNEQNKEIEQLKQVLKELREDNKRLQRCVNDIYTIARLEGLE
jgi:signal transduction histidine kinase